jgi:hypothetical protein
MKINNFENRLALLGALVVLMGVVAAASSAFADQTTEMTPVAALEQQSADVTIAGAREAITESAREAAEAIAAENLFHLENQLTGITSTLIASNK